MLDKTTYSSTVPFIFLIVQFIQSWRGRYKVIVNYSMAKKQKRKYLNLTPFLISQLPAFYPIWDSRPLRFSMGLALPVNDLWKYHKRHTKRSLSVSSEIFKPERLLVSTMVGNRIKERLLKTMIRILILSLTNCY